MSANAVETYTLDYPSLDKVVGLDYPITDEIRTLSKADVDTPGTTISGFLYVPSLSPDSDPPACLDGSSQIPGNVTRRGDLPSGELDLIALAPWTSPECALAYLDAAAADAVVHAFLFYQPGDSFHTPPPKDPAWRLGNGISWKRQHDFPVYALPGMRGGLLITQLALYSGDLSTVPNAGELAKVVPANDIVRLYCRVTTKGGDFSPLPSLWVFLLIVLGVLLLIIGTSSSVMHILQRRRRGELRRRIETGEVDLESLGVKRLTVPQSTIDSLPVEVYNPDDEITQEKAPSLQQPPDPAHVASSLRANENGTAAIASSIPLPESPSSPSSSPLHSATHATCAICLDDFEPHKTAIRVLPCKHAYHPDCIDPFLLASSSLCPLCKQSILPSGFCPPITNAMVRRERFLRRMHERRGDDAGPGDGPTRPGVSSSEMTPVRPGGVSRQRFLQGPDAERVRRLRTFSFLGPSQAQRHRRRSRLAHTPDESQVPATTTTGPDNRDDSQLGELRVVERRELARRRAAALMGINPDEGSHEEESRPRSRFRKIIGTVFPALA